MRFLIVSFAVLFALATSTSSVEAQQAGGETPTPNNWQKTVESLGVALAENDAGALLAVLSDDVSINTFDAKNGDAVRLLARTRKGTLVGALSYSYAPENMAGEIAEAFKSAEVPEELKRKMAMRDDGHARRANRTAVTWLAESLGAKQGDKVGVLIFWCDKPTNGNPEVVFVLLKGDYVSQFSKVRGICFGDPISRPGK